MCSSVSGITAASPAGNPEHKAPARLFGFFETHVIQKGIWQKLESGLHLKVHGKKNWHSQDQAGTGLDDGNFRVLGFSWGFGWT